MQIEKSAEAGHALVRERDGAVIAPRLELAQTFTKLNLFLRIAYSLPPHSLEYEQNLIREHLKRLKTLVRRTNTPWLSDHLCWGSVDGRYTHDLLPIPYTWEAVKDPKFTAESKDGSAEVDSIDTPDDYSVVVNYNTILPTFAAR